MKATRFDVKTNVWLDLKFPPTRVVGGAAVTALNGNIYLLGGMFFTKDGQNTCRNITRHALQYSIETNSWEPLEMLPRPLALHAAASHGNYIFCAGGITIESNGSNKVSAFDPVRNIWLSKMSMNCPRIVFGLEALGAKLVACGGKHSSDVEIYDIADDQWTQIQNQVLMNHFVHSTIVLNDKVYVIGGSHMDVDGTISQTDYVSCVDVDKGTIGKVSSLPFPVNDHACALVTVPGTVADGERSQNNN